MPAGTVTINSFAGRARVGRWRQFRGQRPTTSKQLYFEPAENWETLQPAAVQALNDAGTRLDEEKNIPCPQHLREKAKWPKERNELNR
jgi:hypothetical protein